MILEIALKPAVVQPWLEIFRAHAAVLERTPNYQRELQVFFSLFPPGFAKRGLILVGPDEVIWTLRAAALLRLRIREKDLAVLTGDSWTRGRLEDLPEPLRAPAEAYGFLGILQDRLLKTYPPETFLIPSWIRTFRRAIARVQEVYGTREPDAEPPLNFGVERFPSDPNGHSVVVVRRDAVNSDGYVLAALQLALGLTKNEATARMHEAHQEGQAALWQGSLEQAEKSAAALRDWHLQAEVIWARRL